MKRFILIYLILLIPEQAYTKIHIQFWYAMSGNLGKVLNEIVNDFNHSQVNYQVRAIYKGNYAETLTSTVAAFRAHKQPDVVQVFEIGTMVMIKPKGVIIPVYQLMKQQKQDFNENEYIKVIHDYYSDKKGHLLALPFNCSSPVMFYNKNIFKKVGLAPTHPPLTWPQVGQVAKKIVEAGYKCGFTTGWPSWIQLESFSAWHNIPYATHHNGFDSLHSQLLFNNKLVEKQMDTLAKWRQKHYFVYGGREDNALALFTSGKCAMILESSGNLTGLQKEARFDVGVAPLPYWPTVEGAPQNTIIGGAALWAMSGLNAKHYSAIAAFFKFLAKPSTQAKWQQETGYLPVSKSAYLLSKQQGYYKRHPGADVAYLELTNKLPTVNSKGIRLGFLPQIRNINNDALEAIWSGMLPAKVALAQAVARGNKLLKRYRNIIKNP